MPNIKSAIKRVKTINKAEAQNISQKNAMRTAVKRAKTAIAENAENKNELVRIAVKKVDKASQANLIHSNKADRIKSKLMVAAK
ncbi:30S ribosomal protein S20 [Staphylococcus simulans]|uniref:30S ribosomal protein S20 n=1 Tax=Staphylococcus simulans TaxID=1286 RepID=UPI00366A3C18